MPHFPRTSVIMPVYNTSARVVKAIESVLNQTDSDFELLVLIDGSPDNSFEVIRDFLESHPDQRVRVFNNTKNKGVSATRNQGLDEARGQWIAFIDSDDTFRSDFLKQLHGYAATHDADIVGSLLSIVKAADGSVNDRKGPGTRIFTGVEAALSLLSGTGITPYVCDKIVKRELFDGVRFPLDIHRGEDALATLAVCMNAQQVVMTNEVLYEYLMESGGLTWGRVTPIEESLKALSLQKKLLGSVAETPAGKRAFNTSWVISFLNNAQQALFTNDRDGQKTIDACRQQISWEQVASTLTTNKMFSAAAALLKTSPVLYKKLYGAYVKRTYGL